MPYLKHHGIKGMKWGIRRFQNPDGTLTAAGRKRYLNSDGSLNSEGKLRFKPTSNRRFRELSDDEKDKAAAESFASGSRVRFGTRVRARMQMSRDAQKYAKEFENTEEGRGLKSQWEDRYNAYLKDHMFANRSNNSDRERAMWETFERSDQAAVNKAARILATRQGEFVCNRMIEQYGEVGVSRYTNGSIFDDNTRQVLVGETPVDKFVEDYYDAYYIEDYEY